MATTRNHTPGDQVTVGCFLCRRQPRLLFTYTDQDHPSVTGGWFCNVDHAERWHPTRFSRPITIEAS